MPNWTKEQELAINEEGKNIIVSAGAGSGKTAVLTARVIRKLKDGIDINKLLVLTFTNEAAGEMKARIRKAIKKEASLKKQLDYLDSAYITTFDSYAFSIVRKYNYALNVSKDIKIIDQSIINIIRKHFLEDIFDDLYQESNENFVKLIKDFCVKDDKDIKEAILKISNKIDLRIDKEAYLDNYMTLKFSDDYIANIVCEYEKLLLDKKNDIEGILDSIRIKEDIKVYEDFSLSLERLITASCYEEIKDSINVKIPTLKKDSSIKEEKDSINRILKELKSLTVYDDKEEIKDVYLGSRPYVEAIILIIKRLDEKIKNYKLSKDCYEFTDISLMAIEIVKNNPDIKREIKDYYNEIMVDEYQDTSDLQEAFINQIENNNVYMVGDIKQSIYRFRNANPSIFKDKYNSYTNLNEGMKIDLLKNFRSRKEVLDDINIIFNRIMDDAIGGADYVKSHQMVFGNDTYINEGFTEQNYNLEILNYSNEDNSYLKHEKEIFIIADDIKKKIDSGYQVFDKDEKVLRNATYDDFCIILDRGTNFETYRKIFEYLGIPLSIYQDEDLTSSYDIIIIKNILGLILKIYKKEFDQLFRYLFMSVARSYLVCMNDNEIFEVFKNNDFYKTDLFSKCKDLGDGLSIKTPSMIVNEIIDQFDVTIKTVHVGDLEKSIIRVEYLQKIARMLDDLGYTVEMIYDYLDVMISSDNEIKYKVNSKTSSSVKLMNIHKSKGLEFSICYYAGFYKPFNTSDIKDRFSFDNTYGIITPYFKDGIGEEITKHLSKMRYNKEEVSEKIRLFYVGMTRCKEKMIIVASLKDDMFDSSKVIDNNIRLKYKSFLDIIDSVKDSLSLYIKNISLKDIYMSKDYNKVKTINYKDFIRDVPDKINIRQVNIDAGIKEEKHFSKTVNKIMTTEEKRNMDFGSKIHEVFEYADFNNLDEIDGFYKDKIMRFLNQEELGDINCANIYKEYEFMYEKDNVTYNGVIDLMLVYDDCIKIVDYKLNDITDEAYKKQIFGYKDYVEDVTNKSVKVYLYSILNDKLVNLG